MNDKEKITMYEALERYFERPFKCKLCGKVLNTITGVSTHWRKEHQYQTRVLIIRNKQSKGL
jgi:hypothetical protein